ncbi:hypothetical protein ACFPVX_03540 [Cohnella faecalis]|uniref:Uncharacterized protein n=1 Tax=Cohnella faecalis TaxID=2315694 RepID=A0A398CL65_9BACL|nr:hypothetical protein [Cohnella faecalis]RIE03403.1 hypothetical protein D3H35_12080 [Cohnella faecalis]
MTTENQTPEKTEEVEKQAEMMRLLTQVYQHSITAIKSGFPDNEVDGQIMNHEQFGPLLVFHVKNEQGHVYSCGFFLNELLNKFQKGTNAATYLSSFFVDLMETEGGKPLPQPPQSEDDVTHLIDNELIPHCRKAVQEEFEPEIIHIQLDLHEQYGPVLESGFQAITEGNNVCAVPIPILMIHYLLNRDPADIIINGLYRIRDEHGLGQP